MENVVTFKPGDWVRFYRNGSLVIGVVQYLRRNRIDQLILSTDQGEVQSDMVIEQRQLAEYIKGDG